MWWSVVALGAAAFGNSVVTAASLSGLPLWQLVVGAGLVMFMALFPLKSAHSQQEWSAGEAFVLLLLVLHSPAAGCIAAGLGAWVTSLRASRRTVAGLASAAVASGGALFCGSLLHELILSMGDSGSDLWLVAFAVTSVGLLNAVCKAALHALSAWAESTTAHDSTKLSRAVEWHVDTSAIAAAIAALLFGAQRLLGTQAMLTAVPVISFAFTTLHFYARQRATEHAARRSATQAQRREAELARSMAQQREAELAAQHVRELETSERRFHSAFAHASIGMALLAPDGRIHLANPSLMALLGRTDSDVNGRLFSEFVSPDDARLLHETLSHVHAGTRARQPVELMFRRPDGEEVCASISCSVFCEPQAQGPSLIMQIQDVTARRRAELALEHRSSHDRLTGLPNRDYFHEALGLAIERTDGGPGRAFAVLLLDFDRFKLINDSKGHTIGDEFLVQASRRLAKCLRRGDILARLGGDEFVILASGLDRDSDAVELAERLLDALREPLRLGSMEIPATASIGITFSSKGYAQPGDMLRDADIAMYRAKLDGKARYALFDVQLHTEVTQNVRLETDLRHALIRKELSVVYQPLYELRSGQLNGFEALARWTHAELGAITPATFIPIAEESGLIIALTDFVIHEACRQLAQWQCESHMSDDLCVHVNVAAKDIADRDFVMRVERALLATGVEPRHLVIELTENILMSQLAAAMGTLTDLRMLGVGLSVDDFGTGYSSLSHLSELPIDSLKIDMSFVRQLREGSKAAAVIRAIVSLGKSLGKEVVAEGIETQSQMEILREIGCDFGQGFFLSRPLEAGSVALLLEGQRPAIGTRNSSDGTSSKLMLH